MEKGGGFFVNAGSLPKQAATKCPHCDRWRQITPGLSWDAEPGEECVNPDCPTNLGKKNRGGRIPGW